MANKISKKSAKKVVLKTSKDESSVSEYINSLGTKARDEAHQLDALFQSVTGVRAKMWGGSIIGYGHYQYFRANGDEGEFFATGFALRKSGPVIYIMPGYEWCEATMAKLGPHKLGKSCLYLKRLDDVALDVLEELVSEGLKLLKKSHSVQL